MLEGLFPVRFLRALRPPEAPAARLVRASFAIAAESTIDLPTLQLPEARSPEGADVVACEHLSFADDPEVPWPFRGRSVACSALLDVSAHAIPVGQGERVLAVDPDGRPVWTIRESPRGQVHRTSLRPPHAPAGEDVGIASAGDRFIQVLPLFHFLRSLTTRQGFASPPLRAGFIIDDPNLHWPSYGYADYREIAASARRDRYHVAFATIPLDAWWTHDGTAEIFRQHVDGLSLLIHGNNHAKQELARDISPDACAALLQQAISRIRRLEVSTGLEVSRVMVPPHGACSSHMLAQMPRHGFESACISAGSLRAHNAAQEWTKTLGFAPSETVEACPVLPRWAFGSMGDAALLSAAYLGQPLILRGHHQDLKNGLDVFRSHALKINALGDVRWGSLRELSRLNYRHRIDGSTLHVQPLGTRIDVAVPVGVEQIQLDAVGSEWRVLQPNAALALGGDLQLSVPVVAGSVCSFERRVSPKPSMPARSAPTSLILRRVLTEARDRLRVA